MNNKLNQAMDHISDRHLSEAAAPVRRRYYPYLGAIAAVLALVLVASFLFTPLGQLIAPTPTTTGPILQPSTHPSHPSTSLIPTTRPTYPSTIPSTLPSTTPSIQPSTIPSTQPSGTNTTTSAIIKVDKSVYNLGDTVKFTMLSGTANTLWIYTPDGTSKYIMHTGNAYTYTPTLAGDYTAVLEASRPGTTISFTEEISFRVVDSNIAVTPPCSDANSHNYDKYGWCTVCQAKDPNYNPCPNGHAYSAGSCFTCGASDPDYDHCANGHYFNSAGVCIYCGTPDPSWVPKPAYAYVAADALTYKEGDPVTLHIYCDGTKNTLYIKPWYSSAIQVQLTGNTYIYTPTLRGDYKVYVKTENDDGSLESASITFNVLAADSQILPSNRLLCSNGHFLENGVCTNCGSFVYTTSPCSLGHTYENGYCTKCGYIPCIEGGHVFISDRSRCVKCNLPRTCLSYTHHAENGVCTLCGKTAPSDVSCDNGHVYFANQCVHCMAKDPAACRRNNHDIEDDYCTLCGVPIGCALQYSHSFKNGVCKYCGNLEPKDEDCTLIVNGKDFTAGNYTKINICYGNGSVPLTAVLTELGIPWEWESDTVLRFGSGNLEQTLNTRYAQYNWDTPSTVATASIVRKVVDGEVIVDIQSLWCNLLYDMEIPCEIDCATKTIRIGSDPASHA